MATRLKSISKVQRYRQIGGKVNLERTRHSVTIPNPLMVLSLLHCGCTQLYYYPFRSIQYFSRYPDNHRSKVTTMKQLLQVFL